MGEGGCGRNGIWGGVCCPPRRLRGQGSKTNEKKNCSSCEPIAMANGTINLQI